MSNKYTFSTDFIPFKSRFWNQLISLSTVFSLVLIFYVYMIIDRQNSLFSVLLSGILLFFPVLWFYHYYIRALIYPIKISLSKDKIQIEYFKKNVYHKKLFNCNEINQVELYSSGPGSTKGMFLEIKTADDKVEIYAIEAWTPEILNKIYRLIKECRSKSYYITS